MIEHSNRLRKGGPPSPIDWFKRGGEIHPAVAEYRRRGLPDSTEPTEIKTNPSEMSRDEILKRLKERIVQFGRENPPLNLDEAN
jgi:hypothetical protein